MWLFKRKKPIIVGKRGNDIKLPNVFRRSTYIVILLVIVGLFYLIFLHSEFKKHKRIVYIQTVAIRDATLMFKNDFNRCPAGFEELKHPPTGGNKFYLNEIPIDPWGNRYFIKCPGRWQDVDIGSAGPDGIFFNKDDITNGI